MFSKNQLLNSVEKCDSVKCDEQLLIFSESAPPSISNQPTLSITLYPITLSNGVERGTGGEDPGGQRENRDEKHVFLKDHFLLMIHIQPNLSIIENQRALLGSRNVDLVFLDVFPSQ